MALKDIWCFITGLFAPGPKMMDVKVTAYGWWDNDPPGSATIAFPSLNGKRTHFRAGGVGSYDDPITFAADPKVFKKGTMIYIPRLMKFFIMEDICGAALKRKEGEPPIVDIWIGGTATSDRDDLTEAEENLTRETEKILVNPHNSFSCDPAPLFKG